MKCPAKFSVLFSGEFLSPNQHFFLGIFMEERNRLFKASGLFSQNKQIRIKFTLIKNILVQVFGQGSVSFVLFASQQVVDLGAG